VIEMGTGKMIYSGEWVRTALMQLYREHRRWGVGDW
jgi:hypothetical protein